MDKSQYFLGIDVGTEGTKVALFDINGNVKSSSYEEYPLICPKPGWAEQDPDLWWKVAIKNIKIVIKNSNISSKDIAGVGICGQMHAPVPIDKNGDLLYHSPLLWCDKRNAIQCEKLKSKLNEDELLKISGNVVTTAWMGPKILWMKENLPEIYEKTYKFLVPKDYLVYKLTGMPSIDLSEASGSLLFDVRKEKWSEELANQLEIDLDKLPDIYVSHNIVGEVTSEVAKETGLHVGTPVISGGGDFLCTLLGAGITSKGRAADISGTASIVAFYSEKPLIDKRIMNLHHVIKGWIPFGIVEGGLLRWFRDEFGHMEKQEAEKLKISPYKIMDKEAETTPPGSNGLILIPYFIGERVLGSPYARGVFFGLTLAHQKGHIIRAIMEGITLALRQTLEITEELGLKTEMFRLIGGGAVSPLWRRIKSDIYGIPTALLSTYQGGILGAAILAMVGTGAVNKDPTTIIDEIVSIVEICEPIKENHEKYNKLYILYKKLHDLIQPFYDELEKFKL
jgi:xylulokinase